MRGEGEALIRLLDATPIPLKGDGFAWAKANARTRGLKLHLLYDSRQRRPVWFDVTSAKIDDVVAGRVIPLEKGATYVFDKGYTDYRWWSQIIDAGAVFVTRRKRNAQCRDIREQPASGDGILADRRLKIGHRQPRGGAPINPLYQAELREITVARPDHDQPLYLLTNDFERPATDIARRVARSPGSLHGLRTRHHNRNFSSGSTYDGTSSPGDLLAPGALEHCAAERPTVRTGLVAGGRWIRSFGTAAQRPAHSGHRGPLQHRTV